MATIHRSLPEINTLDEAAFVEALSPLFEGPPRIATLAWPLRPFRNRDHLYEVLCSIMYQAPQEQQIALLRAHPDLVGRAALAGTLSPSSTHEQASAGLDHLSSDDIATFQRLNQTYSEQFSFPFVICARENKLESILTGFSERLHHTREQEITIALGEVAKICALRLDDLLKETDLL